MAQRIVRSRFPSRGGGSKRSVSWSVCSTPTGLSVLAAGQKGIAVLVQSSILLDLIPFTITRTVGICHIDSDQSGASEVQLGAIGAGLVNDVAGALGATGVPGPATDCGWSGWFMHQFFVNSFLFVSGVGTQTTGKVLMFDSRAQRKVSAEEDIIFMVENFGTVGLRFGLSFRMLLKAG